ncbi:MAG: hypothetical protein AAF639_35390 [Chloroflexota bacterium]
MRNDSLDVLGLRHGLIVLIVIHDGVLWKNVDRHAGSDDLRVTRMILVYS